MAAVREVEDVHSWLPWKEKKLKEKKWQEVEAKYEIVETIVKPIYKICGVKQVEKFKSIVDRPQASDMDILNLTYVLKNGKEIKVVADEINRIEDWIIACYNGVLVGAFDEKELIGYYLVISND